MRTVKLIFIFILCVGNVVLLLNISDVFGSKQYPSNELSETDKEALFAEMLKDKINDDKEFFNTEDVKQIVEKYNKLRQSVQHETAKETPPAPQDTVEGKTAAEVEDSRKNVDKNVVAVEDVAAKATEDAFEKSKTKDQIKAEILELVKKKDLNGCRNHPGWKTLKWEDRVTVESLLNTGKYDITNKKTGKREYSKAAAKNINAYIEKLDFNSFKTWKDLENAQYEIIRINRISN